METQPGPSVDDLAKKSPKASVDLEVDMDLEYSKRSNMVTLKPFTPGSPLGSPRPHRNRNRR